MAIAAQGFIRLRFWRPRGAKSRNASVSGGDGLPSGRSERDEGVPSP